MREKPDFSFSERIQDFVIDTKESVSIVFLLESRGIVRLSISLVFEIYSHFRMKAWDFIPIRDQFWKRSRYIESNIKTSDTISNRRKCR